MITQNQAPDNRDIGDLTFPGTDASYSTDGNAALVLAIRYLIVNAPQDFVNAIKELWEDITDLVTNVVGDVAAAVKSAAAAAITLTPIALDLNGNGRIDTLSANTSTNKVFFDIDNTNSTNDNFAVDNDIKIVKLFA